MNYTRKPENITFYGNSRPWRVKVLEIITQVEKYGPVPAGKHRKSPERGSSIPTGKFSDFFR